MRRQPRIVLLPVRNCRWCVFPVEIGHIADRLALLQQEGTARQIRVPSLCRFRPRDVAGVILAEWAERHSRSMRVVNERLEIAGVKYDAVDASHKILVGQGLEVERTLSPGGHVGPGRE